MWVEMAWCVTCGWKWGSLCAEMAQRVGGDSVVCGRRWRRSWAEMGSDNVACGWK